MRETESYGPRGLRLGKNALPERIARAPERRPGIAESLRARARIGPRLDWLKARPSKASSRQILVEEPSDLLEVTDGVCEHQSVRRFRHINSPIAVILVLFKERGPILVSFTR